MNDDPESISEIIEDVKQSFGDEIITIGAILNAFHERGFGFVLLVFSLPMALPVPVPPGINILLATPLLILTAQQALGKHSIWIPGAVKRKTLQRSKFVSLLDKITPWLQKLEILVKPRLGFITQGAFSHLIGILGFIMAMAVCVPLPLTNTVPSLGIVLMAIGVIARDGLAVFCGAVLGILWVGMLILVVVFLDTEGIDIVKETIRSFF